MSYAEKAKKHIFIKNLEMTLWFDQERNGVEGIDYVYDEETKEEYITIEFKGGHSETIAATANSNGANAKAIINAIY